MGDEEVWQKIGKIVEEKVSSASEQVSNFMSQRLDAMESKIVTACQEPRSEIQEPRAPEGSLDKLKEKVEILEKEICSLKQLKESEPPAEEPKKKPKVIVYVTSEEARRLRQKGETVRIGGM